MATTETEAELVDVRRLLQDTTEEKAEVEAELEVARREAARLAERVKALEGSLMTAYSDAAQVAALYLAAIPESRIEDSERRKGHMAGERQTAEHIRDALLAMAGEVAS